jgi:type I restriction enzyme M protein
MDEIKDNDYNLNISRYVSTTVAEEEVDIVAVNRELISLEEKIRATTDQHNKFLKELGLPLLPS